MNGRVSGGLIEHRSSAMYVTGSQTVGRQVFMSVRPTDFGLQSYWR